MPAIQLPQNFTQKQIIMILVGVVVAGILIFAVMNGVRPAKNANAVKMTLWGPLPEREAMAALSAAYKGVRPNVDITYQEITNADYYGYVLNALATGKGPDMMLIDNHALDYFGDKLSPIESPFTPKGLTKPVSFNLANYRSTFPRVAEQDFVRQGYIFAAPLYIDTLALIFNKNALDQAGLAEPPRTWTDVQNFVPYLRKVNDNGQITRAAVALGGTESTVKNAVDILNLLMIQNGVVMSNAQGRAVFFEGEGKSAKTGVAAMNYYLQFANSSLSAYTWNEQQPYSMDAISSGRVAMAFGYYGDYLDLKRKNPYASLEVAEMPQLEGSSGGNISNYAKYYGVAVLAASPNRAWAWDFLVNGVSNPVFSAAYAEAVNRPPAIRSVILRTENDPEKGIFARQALTAASWSQPDPNRVVQIFDDAISDVLKGRVNSADALRRAQGQISGLIRSSE